MIPPLPPSSPPPANPAEHARRMLARAERGRAVNEQGLRRAAARNRWDVAERHAGRAMAAERAVLRWQAALSRLLNSRGPYRFDDAFEGEGDAFLRVLRVLSAARTPDGRPRLRTGGTMGGVPVQRQLWNTSQGIFLDGASQAQARQWAQRQAQRVGGNVVFDTPHGPGARPHFHVERPGGERSGHIFYGSAPGGLFFESD